MAGPAGSSLGQQRACTEPVTMATTGGITAAEMREILRQEDHSVLVEQLDELRAIRLGMIVGTEEDLEGTE